MADTLPTGFVDTSTEEAFNAFTSEEDTNDLDQFPDVNILKGFEGLDASNQNLNPNADAATAAAATEDGDAAATTAAAAAATTTENDDAAAGEKGGGADQTPDYAGAFIDFMKGQGLDVRPEDLGGDFGEAQMNARVEEHYASKFIKDPLMFELAKSGLTIDDHFSTIVPLHQQLSLDDKQLYMEVEATKLLNKDIADGKVDKEDPEAVKAAVLGYRTTLEAQLEAVPEAMLKTLLTPVRKGIEEEITALPKKIQAYKTQQYEVLKNKEEADYKAFQSNMVSEMKKEVAKGNNYGFSFKDQVEQDEFVAYADAQTQLTEIKVKKEDGTESTVQDIPFMHRLNTDPHTVNKVLRILHAMEKGTLTDVKNAARADIKNQLNITPVLPGATGGKNTQTRAFVDTSKPH